MWSCRGLNWFFGGAKLIFENEKSKSDSEPCIVRASNRSPVSNVCKIDRSSSLRGAVSRTPRVYAPSKLIGLHRPLHITRIYISAFESALAFPASISLLLEYSPRFAQPPQFHTTPRATLSKRPGRFRRALVMCASAMKCKQAQYYSLFVGFTRTGLCRCRGRAGLNAARDGSICSTTRKRPPRN